MLIGALPLPARAQSRGALQVAVRVLEAGPSRAALHQAGRAAADPTRRLADTPLASVRIEALRPDSTAGVRRRITIAFVRN